MVDRCRCVVVRRHRSHASTGGHDQGDSAVRHDLLIGLSMGAIGSALAIAAGILALIVAAEHHDPVADLGE